MLSNFRCFLRSMLRWARPGFKLVPYYQYWRRRVICRSCNANWPRCPICGCWLWAYARLGTSECRNWTDINDTKTGRLVSEDALEEVYPKKG